MSTTPRPAPRPARATLFSLMGPPASKAIACPEPGLGDDAMPAVGPGRLAAVTGWATGRFASLIAGRASRLNGMGESDG